MTTLTQNNQALVPRQDFQTTLAQAGGHLPPDWRITALHAPDYDPGDRAAL